MGSIGMHEIKAQTKVDMSLRLLRDFGAPSMVVVATWNKVNDKMVANQIFGFMKMHSDNCLRRLSEQLNETTNQK